ncbi:S-layer homology domain-containing protein [Paenibacillus sp. NFR01]|uniref:S-layer homology domain-containing protein n=1 Tax=Paenibacillus sp. NFR01 TaxID=1566279 RepID=UPI0008C9FC0D|nr:S-layer homology domain-containing protein [Paenibacillus sp. NFR01]SET06446.1 Listeria/Bacterioides repeat-containing protein [Paenibacillus sp. NFR01]
MKGKKVGSLAICLIVLFVSLVVPGKEVFSANASWLDITGEVSLNSPSGIAVDSTGNVYVADTSNNKIKELSGGVWTDITGEETFNKPSDIAVDQAGNLYVTDTGNGKIKMLPKGGTWKDLNIGGFEVPYGIAVDEAGNVYVSDSGLNKIKKWSVESWTDITGSGGLSSPKGIAVDKDGNIYVADAGNKKLKKLVGSSWADITPGGMGEPHDVSVTSGGNLYISAVSSAGTRILEIMNGAIYDITGMESFSDAAIAVNSGDYVYVADTGNKKIKKLTITNAEAPVITLDPEKVTVVSKGDTNPKLKIMATVSDGGFVQYQWYVNDVESNSGGVPIPMASVNLFEAPTNALGTFYYYAVVTNQNPNVTGEPRASISSRVVKVTVTGAGPSYSWSDVGSAGALYYPSDVKIASNGDMYVADSWNKAIKKFSQEGWSDITGGNFFNPIGVAADSNGNVYAVDSYNSLIKKWSNGVWTDITGNGGFHTPAGIAVDSSGNVYVADTFSDKIKKWSGSDWTDISGDAVKRPRGIAMDSSGNLYATDSQYQKVMKLSGGKWTDITFNGGFQPGYNTLYGIAVDKDGNVYISDTQQNKIWKLTGDSWTDVTGTGLLSAPYGVAVDSSGTVFVADSANHTIKKLIVTENTPVDAATPSILDQPTGGTVNLNETGPTLSVTASVIDHGMLSYQWYSNSSNSTDTGTLISGATESSYKAPTSKAGTTYYYVIVKNTNDAANGNKTAEKTSDIAAVVVNTAAAIPSIGSLPASTTVTVGEPGPTLSVSASVSDDGKLSYQWYSNSKNNTEEGTPISGATGPSYTVPAATQTGTAYYYVIVKNTNNNVSGTKIKTVTSNAAAVTVTPALPKYTVAFDSQGGSSVNDIGNIASGTSIAAPTPPTKSGYSFQGWYKDAAGTEAWNFGTDTVTGNVTLFAKWAVQTTTNPTNPTNPTSPATGDTGNAGDDSVAVLVNGIEVKAGKVASSVEGTQKVTTLSVSQEQVDKKLDAEGIGAVVTFPVHAVSDVIVSELNGQMVKNMENKQAILEIKTDKATYTLPAEQMDIDSISKQIGSTVALQDIKIQIRIATPMAPVAQAAVDALGQSNLTMVAPPLDFTIKATYQGSTVDVSKFNAYVERLIALPDQADPNKITTGVVVDPDGVVRHVPTKVTVIDGKYYAQINSLSNSLYSVVWHPLEFKDVDKHWAKAAVNDMGSRLVIEGVGNGMFNPDTNITRAEFAAIIVRGLGLKPVTGTSAFTDVAASDWYHSAVQTAYEYKLIEGFGDGAFHPKENITREQAMVIIAKAMKITGLQGKLATANADERLTLFSDAGIVANWARNGVTNSLQAGIFTGRSASRLAPKANITRAEVAAIMQRLLKKSDLI